MTDFKVGDLCITCNTEAPLLNDGLLVEVVAVDPAHLEGRRPYRIRRVDGQAFPLTGGEDQAPLAFFRVMHAWARPEQLRRLPPEEAVDAAHATRKQGVPRNAAAARPRAAEVPA